jgi:hypothetical protein
VRLGAQSPPQRGLPHAWMAPAVSRAAKAAVVEKMFVKPVPVGAPDPPLLWLPQARMPPCASRAAKASVVEKMAVNPVTC